jgi:hypothetical protein
LNTSPNIIPLTHNTHQHNTQHTPPPFRQIADRSKGVVNVRFRRVACPPGNGGRS